MAQYTQVLRCSNSLSQTLNTCSSLTTFSSTINYLCKFSTCTNCPRIFDHYIDCKINMAKTIIYCFFTILISYCPKKSPSTLLRVEPHLNFIVVIFKLLLQDNIQRQSVLCWAVTNMQKYNGLLEILRCLFFLIIVKLKCFVHTF